MNKIQVYYAIAQAFQKVSMFVLFFMVARILGSEEYGLYSYIYVVIASISGVLTEAFMVGIANFSDKDKADKRSLFSYSMYLIAKCIFVVSVLISVSCYLLIFFFDLKLGYNVFISINAFIYALLLGPILVATQVFAGNWRYGALVFSLNSILVLIVVVIAAIISKSGEVVLLFHGLISMFLITLFCFLGQKYGAPIDMKEAKYYFLASDFNGFIKKTALSMMLNAPTHMICVTLLMMSGGVKEVGVFNAFFILYTAITFMPALLNMYVVKYLASQNIVAIKKNVFSLLEWRYIGFSIFILLMVSLVGCIFSEYIESLYGLDFYRIGIIYWVLASSCLGSSVIIFNQIFYAREKPGSVLIGSTIYSLLYLTLSVFLYIKGQFLATNLYVIISISALGQLIYLVANAHFSGRKKWNTH